MRSGRVMWTKCLPRDTLQPIEAALRNSNEIICKHKKLRLQVPGKGSSETGPTVNKQLLYISRFNFVSLLSY